MGNKNRMLNTTLGRKDSKSVCRFIGGILKYRNFYKLYYFDLTLRRYQTLLCINWFKNKLVLHIHSNQELNWLFTIFKLSAFSFWRDGFAYHDAPKIHLDFDRHPIPWLCHE